MAEESEPTQEPEVESVKQRKPKRLLITTAIAVVIVAVVLLAVMLSPQYSPLASIHDTDGDGVADSDDAFPNDASETKDTDGDGYGDNCDCFPEDDDEWLDGDEDGVGDNSDEFPEDPDEWEDTDGDGTGDNGDAFPNDPDEWLDTDDDGVGDNSDAFPTDSTQWTDRDGDGYGDNPLGIDPDEFPDDPDEWKDTDGDGYGDNGDEFPEDPDEWEDTDGDGYGDNSDAFPEDDSRSTPVTRFIGEETWNGFAFECIYTDMPIPWDDVTFCLSSSLGTAFWTTASTKNLSSELNAVQDLGTRDLNGMAVTIIAADLIGNGILEVGDFFSVSVEDGFTEGVEFLLEVIYEPTECAMDSHILVNDIPEPETPTIVVTSRTSITSPDGYKFSLTAPSSEVTWTDLTIVLQSGADSYAWTTATQGGLTGSGVTVQALGASSAIGGVTFFCNVTDLAGNGLMNNGDYFTITGSFASGTSYTVTLIYEPTGGQMVSMTWTA